MNEMEQLRRFRDGVPEPDDQIRERALAALRDAGGDRMPQRSDRRPRRRWTAPLGVAAAALALVIALPAVLPLGGPGAPDPAAADVLHVFARIARNAPAEPVPEPGQFIYSETMSAQTNLFVASDGQRFVFEEVASEHRWLGTDGSGRIVGRAEEPRFPTAADEAAYHAYLASPTAQTDDADSFFGESFDDVYAAGDLTFRDTSDLPTDPDRLRDLIEDREIVGGPPGDWETFVLAADLIRDSYARPDLRAALYEVMAQTPGIELIGPTVDAAGRDGIALASTHDGLRYEVVFDRRTAKVLEEREIAIDDGLAEDVGDTEGPTAVAYATAGMTWYRGTYLTFGEVVDSTSESRG